MDVFADSEAFWLFESNQAGKAGSVPARDLNVGIPTTSFSPSDAGRPMPQLGHFEALPRIRGLLTNGGILFGPSSIASSQ